jgi:3-hydroxyisobutyrate dehydrogenase-like beta-hydroxyacid dehydrogenase
MGASVGAAASGRARVLWSSSGRSGATRDRAARAGLEDAGSIEALVAASDLVISVCPPHAAEEVATAVAADRFGGVYLDANAISPARTRRIGELVAAGVQFVDSGISAVPPGGRAPRGCTSLEPVLPRLRPASWTARSGGGARWTGRRGFGAEWRTPLFEGRPPW